MRGLDMLGAQADLAQVMAQRDAGLRAQAQQMAQFTGPLTAEQQQQVDYWRARDAAAAPAAASSFSPAQGAAVRTVSRLMLIVGAGIGLGLGYLLTRGK